MTSISPLHRLILAATITLTAASAGTLDAQQEQRPARLVAIGDLHGDMQATIRVLRLAGAVDSGGRWIGGRLVVVQTGDIVDRGGDEREILALFDRLAVEAEQAGGAIHLLNGNHELMNAYFDFRYVTDEGFRTFTEEVATSATPLPEKVTAEQRGRALAFAPGGPIARSLARRPTMMVLNGIAFVHGGILPEHARRGLELMNREVSDWLNGNAPQPEWIRGSESPVWTRLYSKEPDKEACDTAREALGILGARLMVVGHTVHKQGITSHCGGAIWAIDVGMSSYYGGPTQALEFRGDTIRVLRAPTANGR